MKIEKFDIDSLSFRQLKVLLTVIELESVNKAAELLNTNQSNISYALDKLRQAFDDPLFVRYGNGVKPTPTAQIIADQIKPIIDNLNALPEQSSFNPGELDKTFVIGATSYEINLILPALRDLLWSQAPLSKLSIKLIGEFNFEALVHDCHVLLSPHLTDIANIRYRTLFSDPYLTYYDASVRKAPKTLKAFSTADHAVVVYGSHANTRIDDALKKLKLERNIKLQVGNFDFLPVMMKGTDLISTLPSRFTKNIMADFGTIKCPIELDPIQHYCLWHERYQHDPTHRWLRSLIIEACAQLKASDHLVK